MGDTSGWGVVVLGVKGWGGTEVVGQGKGGWGDQVRV